MPRSAPFLGLLVLLLTTLGCASTGMPSGRLRVTLLDHVGRQQFELVSESHTPPLEYYSTPRDEAERKILEDPIVGALVAELDGQGFARYAQDGRAPRGSTRITRSLEIEDDGRVRHWSVGTGTEATERGAFLEASSTVLQLYNVARSYQAIENDEGARVFGDGSPSRSPQRP